jgi:hypothetical protein|tara:strand:+ start:905 stop:1366 length:462 start_codon:yes stop_codon:yes gene_type:complete
MNFDKVLIVLSNDSAFNKEMLDSMYNFFKINKSNLNWCHFIDVPLKFPIDTEDKYFQKLFEKSEQIRKEFYDKMNFYKIPVSRLSGNVYKVRNMTSGLVELGKNYNPDLLIIPQILMNLKLHNSKFKNNPYVNLKKISSSISASIMIWHRGDL